MSINVGEQDLVQNSRIFFEAYLPGAIARLRNQSLALIEGVADREEALEGLDRTQLNDAVRKFLDDWKTAGGTVEVLLDEASERGEFRIQTPFNLFATPFPLVLRCQKCGALDNHTQSRRQQEHVVSSTEGRISGGSGYSGKGLVRCTQSGCHGIMQQVPYVVVHRCGHLAPMSTPPSARGIPRLGLRHNTGAYRQNTFFNLDTGENVGTAHTDLCPTCTATGKTNTSALQKGTPVSSGDAFFPQTIQFVALSKQPGELVSNIQAEHAQHSGGMLSGRMRDVAEGIAYGLLGLIDSHALQTQLLRILEGNVASPEEIATINAKRVQLETEIKTLTDLIQQGIDLSSAVTASKDRLSALTSQLGIAEGTFADVRHYLADDAVLWSLIGERRTMESILLRHDVGCQDILSSIESTADVVVRLSRSEDWKHLQTIYGIRDIAHIPDLNVVLAAVGFSREKREPERTQGDIAVKLNPFEDHVKSSAKGKANIYAISAKTEALRISIDPVRVLEWCVQHAGWNPPPERVLSSSAYAHAYLIEHSSALTASPGSVREITRSIGYSAAAPFHLLHSIAHVLMLTARRHSGYDSQSLTEYLMPMDLSFLVYVTSVQNYTAGGLLTLFQHYLRRWFDDAALQAFNCAFDPICSDVGSACPGCIHIARGCETFNSGVSRAYLYGGYVDKNKEFLLPKGYWQA